LLNNSVPVALACDDPQFFGKFPLEARKLTADSDVAGNFGLSYDFYQVFTSSEQMTILGLGKLARQSIEVSPSSSS
jgi:adenosine deaminase CECR1